MKTLNTLQVRHIKITFTSVKISDYYNGHVYKELDSPGMLILNDNICEIYMCGRLTCKINCDEVWKVLEIKYKR